MYIFIVLMLMGVKSSGTATLSFIFPEKREEAIVIETEKISEPLVSVSRVVENDSRLEIDLVSQSNGFADGILTAEVLDGRTLGNDH